MNNDKLLNKIRKAAKGGLVLFFHAGLLALSPGAHLRISKYASEVEEYAAGFSRKYKAWTEDTTTINSINNIFEDSLTVFYSNHSHAIDNLSLRLESVMDSVNGKRLASFECWDHYVDNKKLRVHVYVNIPDTLKKLFVGNDYLLFGKIEKFDVRHGVGYNKTDNSCDAGIVTIIPEKIIHLKGHNKST